MGSVKTITCPGCGKETVWKGNPYRPFCSERCKLIDLGDWATGKHAIPGEAVEKEETEEEE